jgi:hypothetical protein
LNAGPAVVRQLADATAVLVCLRAGIVLHVSHLPHPAHLSAKRAA